jgi:uncharacterized protein (TIGR02231 family)
MHLFALGLSGAPVVSRIGAVTVYQDRAVVTRSATVTVETGENTVVFENLPTTLVDQSLNASARGVTGVSILDVTASTVVAEAAPSERVKELEDQIRRLLKQRRVLDDRSKILEQQRIFVDRMLQASTAVPVPGVLTSASPTSRTSLEEWQRLMAYSDETLGKIASEQQEIDSTREELQTRQTALERQLNELRGARGRPSKVVRVRVASTAPGRMELSIQYSVPNAGWSPSYDARLRTAERAVDLSYFGVVRNGTGEDWKDVALTLSTARPGLGGGAPELPVWIADIARQPAPAPAPPPRGGRGAAPGAQPTQQGFNNAQQGFNNAFNTVAPAGRGDVAPVDFGVLVAAVEVGVTSATFKIPVAVSVVGNNVSQKVPINTGRLPANLQFQSTPKSLEAAFLSAYANNGSEYPMLAGPMNTFLDETFIAASNLRTVMPGERFEIALGADDGITVKRRVVNRFTEDTGLTNKNRRVTFEILVTITNKKTTEERVVFKEPTPVSRDEKIVVKVLAPTEKEIGTLANPKEVTREEDGKLVWRVNMKPGEKREFPLKVSIEHPGDILVSGLE